MRFEALSWISLWFLLCYSNGNDIIVRTNYGPIRGKQSYVLGKNVYEFLGVPYARPPIGDLRFKFPQKMKPWTEIWPATDYRDACVQPLPERYDYSDATTRTWLPEVPFSEDCLYLNIWSRANNHTHGGEGPERADADANSRTSRTDGRSTLMLESSALFGPKSGRPVMVWIHGGSLTRGSAALEMYNGAYLASKMDVVVVSVQYRLGPFGFLYLGTDDAPGNQGLMDQVAALEWIRDNIAYFGGNPRQITLFGHAGGVVCVSLHLLSPVSSTLFQQAILQSGSPLAWWAIESQHTALEKAHSLATLTGCKVHSNQPSELSRCLRSVDAGTLEMNQWQMHMLRNGENSSRTMQLKRLYRDLISPRLILTAGYYFDIPFKPVVAAPLLPQWPYEILGSGKLNLRHRIMLGVNEHEGMYHMVHSLRMYFMKFDEWPEMPREFGYSAALTDPLDLLALYIMDENFLHSVLLQATVFEYQIPSLALGNTGWTAERVLKALDEVGGDYNIKCPVVEFADFYSRSPNAQVFFYSFEHRTKAMTWPQWTGVMQGYEAEYIFGAPFNPLYQKTFYNFTDDERRLSEEMMRFWTNFASTGSPNLNPGEFHTRNKALYWERYKPQSPISRATFKADTKVRTSTKPVADTSRQHMMFSLPQSHMGRNLRRHHCMFWREQLPRMREQILYNARCKSAKPTVTTPNAASPTGIRQPPGSMGTLYPDRQLHPTKKSNSAPLTLLHSQFLPTVLISTSMCLIFRILLTVA